VIAGPLSALICDARVSVLSVTGFSAKCFSNSAKKLAASDTQHSIMLSCSKRAYDSVIPSRGRWLAMESSTMGPVSHEELRRLAIKLREDLINCEGKLGSTREFAELMDTAGALIIAITEPEEYSVFARGSEKLIEFPSKHRRQTAS
jgi:hypothetical protein